MNQYIQCTYKYYNITVLVYYTVYIALLHIYYVIFTS